MRVLGGIAYAGVMCVGLSGCSQNGPQCVPVTGTVTYKGQPVREGTVVFVPTIKKKGEVARGITNERGEFSLRTFSADDGAIPGQYRVAVTAYRPPDPRLAANLIAPPAGPPAVPKKYFDQSTTDLTATVEDGPTTIALELRD